MNSRSKYKTRQHALLLAYLESVAGIHITVADICDHFSCRGIKIGRSTIYRLLEGLVSEGYVNKYTVDGSTAACFEYVGPDSHVHGGDCFHCKCESCGKLIHLCCEELESLRALLREKHGFTLDPVRTVFYGLCDNCMSSSGISSEKGSGKA